MMRCYPEDLMPKWTPEQQARYEAAAANATEADVRAIASDWRIIGDDLRRVMAANPPSSLSWQGQADAV